MPVRRPPTPVAVAACLLGALSAPTQAATLSYLLDESNVVAGLPTGTGYLRVRLADGADGAIDVTVTILEPLLDLAGPNFGLQSFGFNSDTQILNSANIDGLPSGWSVATSRNQNGFGRFDLVVRGRGSSRVSPTLSFAIVGIAGDTVFDYVAWSGGHAVEGTRWFAAHVAGLENEQPDTTLEPLTSAFFAPSRAVIPVPPAAWLFAAAIGALGWARRWRA